MVELYLHGVVTFTRNMETHCAMFQFQTMLILVIMVI